MGYWAAAGIAVTGTYVVFTGAITRCGIHLIATTATVSIATAIVITACGQYRNYIGYYNFLIIQLFLLKAGIVYVLYLDAHAFIEPI